MTVDTNSPSGKQDAITILTQDHRNVEKMFEAFQRLGDAGEKVALISKIITELAVHATAEERHLYTALSSDPKTLEAIEEHHAMKLLMAEVADMTGDEVNVVAKVKVLSEMVEHHVKEEEEDLFPKLKATGIDLDTIGALILEEKAKLKDGMAMTVGNQTAPQLGGAPRIQS